MGVTVMQFQKLNEVNGVISSAEQRITDNTSSFAKYNLRNYISRALAACKSLSDGDKVKNYERIIQLHNYINEKLCNIENIEFSHTNPWETLDEIDIMISSFTVINYIIDEQLHTNELFSYFLRSMNQIDALFFSTFSKFSK